MSIQIIMPQLGESVVDGTVVEWLKQVGDSVEEYEPIVRVSTDKVDTEVPAPTSGILLEIIVPEESTVDSGVVLGIIGATQDDHTPVEPNRADNIQNVATQTASTPESVQPTSRATNNHHPQQNGIGHITPVVARMAQVHQLDLSLITGSGRNGRITKKDVLAFMENNVVDQVEDDIPPWERPGTGDLFKPTVEYNLDEQPQAPSQSPAPKQPVPKQPVPKQPAPKQPAPQSVTSSTSYRDIPGELTALSGMRRSIADHMVKSKQTAPHVTTVFEVDLSAIVAHRQAHKDDFARQDTRLTFTPYFVQAVVQGLQAHPILNARWVDDGIYQHQPIHIGLAVALDDGLIVPVIKNAQDYNLQGLARQVNDLAERARQRKLKPDEVRGGTFSITNHGVSGSLFATPIINQPQSAILGVGAIEKRVKVIDDAIAIRSCAYLSLTFDHRLIDGATADNFVATVVSILQSW